MLARFHLTAFLALIASPIGCTFEGGTATATKVDAAPIDADLPSTCEPGELRCSGRFLGTCNAAGDDFDLESCAFTCAEGQCVEPSNLNTTSVALCGEASERISPPSGSTLEIRPGPEIFCDQGCGDPEVMSIAASGLQQQSGGAELAIFCLTELVVPDGVIIEVETGVEIPQALTFFVDGAVTIDGGIVVSGQAATDGEFGRGGPAGGGGGPFGSTDGNPGAGPCGGATGVRAGSASDFGPGGGGGGGMAALGGSGGEGINGSGSATGAGGDGGGVCANDDLIPLVAGSGGGGGPDGTCSGECGWPGGGGGGAIQISSRVSIAIGGMVEAVGGTGFGFLSGNGAGGGGGGGGSGGAVLLEAPSVSIAGMIRVLGGSGGPSRAGVGGIGGDGLATLVGTNGSSQDADDEPGAGGGGSAGRLRLRSVNPTELCSPPRPAMSCSAAPLTVAIPEP